MERKTLARQLVEAFGDPMAMEKLYHPDVVWHMQKSLKTVFGPYIGKSSVVEFNHRVWGKFYYPEVDVEILDELGDESLSAVRFNYRAKLRNSGDPYDLEYAVFAKAKDGLITDVYELLDSMGSVNLFSGNPVDRNPYRD